MKMNLSWVVVDNLDKSVEFFTKVVGLKVREKNDMFGWAELIADDGAALGLAEMSDPLPPGSNAVITITVDDLEKAKAEMSEKGAKMHGDVVEVPGHVKMQLFTDPDNNHFQLVERL